MNDLFSRLVTRARTPVPGIRPVLPSAFEEPPGPAPDTAVDSEPNNGNATTPSARSAYARSVPAFDQTLSPGRHLAASTSDVPGNHPADSGRSLSIATDPRPAIRTKSSAVAPIDAAASERSDLPVSPTGTRVPNAVAPSPRTTPHATESEQSVPPRRVAPPGEIPLTLPGANRDLPPPPTPLAKPEAVTSPAAAASPPAPRPSPMLERPSVDPPHTVPAGPRTASPGARPSPAPRADSVQTPSADSPAGDESPTLATFWPSPSEAGLGSRSAVASRAHASPGAEPTFSGRLQPRESAAGSRRSTNNLPEGNAHSAPQVHVSIGRLEVRAVLTPTRAASSAPAPFPPSVSLEEYLQRPPASR